MLDEDEVEDAMEQLRAMEMQPKLDRLQEELVRDSQYWNALLKINDSQFHRRALVRSVMAYLEGSSHVLRETMLLEQRYYNKLLSDMEWEYLRNRKFNLSEKGILEENAKGFHPTRPLFYFTLRCYGKIKDIGYKLDLGNKYYPVVIESFDIRDSLAHPKDVTSLDITDQNLDQVRTAFNWYLTEINSIEIKYYSQIIENMRKENLTGLKQQLIAQLEILVQQYRDVKTWGLLE